MRRLALPTTLTALLLGALACGGGPSDADSDGNTDTGEGGDVFIDNVGGSCEGSTVTLEAETDGPAANMTVEVYDGEELVGATAMSERNDGNWIAEEPTSTFGYSDCTEMKLGAYLLFIAQGNAGQYDESATDATIL